MLLPETLWIYTKAISRLNVNIYSQIEQIWATAESFIPVFNLLVSIFIWVTILWEKTASEFFLGTFLLSHIFFFFR